MVLTVLQAQVRPEKAGLLEQAFGQAVRQLDDGIASTFLLRSAKEPEVWQIATLWHSREALDAMRRSGETPRGVLMFRAAGAEPVLSIWDVVAEAAAPATPPAGH